ncbi:MAG: SGNH/GDSL hydrolase family protein [FCB group bacterium]|nr:SGNH/GDSL hydrolase family protein [FCB group bacterium]
MKAALTILALVCAVSCASLGPEARGGKMKVAGESLVLVKTEPGRLCFDGVVEGSVTLRSTYLPGKDGCVVYEEGKDFVVDYANGTIARTADSRIPDYSTNVMFGLKDFDHSKLPQFTNHPWFVWADYETANGKAFAKPNRQGKYLKNTRKKLEAGGPFLIATYGDSITAGGEASEPTLRFQDLYAKYLQNKFPKAQVSVKDVSIPGYTSKQGVEWYDKYIGTVEKPDLVLLGFGMNDHNIGSVKPEQYKANLVALTKMIREKKGAEVVIFSTFPPNENWHYGSHRMALYEAAARDAAAEAQCAYVDVYSTWMMVLERKDQSSLLGNNINHPNDFGHWIYEQAFEAMRF